MPFRYSRPHPEANLRQWAVGRATRLPESLPATRRKKATPGVALRTNFPRRRSLRAAAAANELLWEPQGTSCPGGNTSLAHHTPSLLPASRRKRLRQASRPPHCRRVAGRDWGRRVAHPASAHPATPTGRRLHTGRPTPPSGGSPRGASCSSQSSVRADWRPSAWHGHE